MTKRNDGKSDIRPRARSKPDAAREMGIGLYTLNRLIADGRIQTISVYDRQMVALSEIERFLRGEV